METACSSLLFSWGIAFDLKWRRRSLVSGLCAAPLLRTHSPGGAVDRRTPVPSPVSGLKWQAFLPGNPHVYLEMRTGCQGMITFRTLRATYSLNLQLGDCFARVCLNPRSRAGSVACDENREMLRGTV